RPLPSIRLGDHHPPDRLCPVRSTSQSFGEIHEVLLQLLSVGPPRLPVHSWRCIPLEAKVRLSQGVDVVDVMKERSKPSPLVRLRPLPYAVPRTEHAFPALGPARVLRARIPLGLTASLPPLRVQPPPFPRF